LIEVARKYLVLVIKSVFFRGVLQLLFNANVVFSSLILFTLMKMVTNFSEASVPTKVTRRRIPEYDILRG
jgi:hypothetical protein